MSFPAALERAMRTRADATTYDERAKTLEEIEERAAAGSRSHERIARTETEVCIDDGVIVAGDGSIEVGIAGHPCQAGIGG